MTRNLLYISPDPAFSSTESITSSNKSIGENAFDQRVVQPGVFACLCKPDRINDILKLIE